MVWTYWHSMVYPINSYKIPIIQLAINYSVIKNDHRKFVDLPIISMGFPMGFCVSPRGFDPRQDIQVPNHCLVVWNHGILWLSIYWKLEVSYSQLTNSYIGNVIIPTDALIFFRGIGLNHQPVDICNHLVLRYAKCAKNQHLWFHSIPVASMISWWLG